MVEAVASKIRIQQAASKTFSPKIITRNIAIPAVLW